MIRFTEVSSLANMFLIEFYVWMIILSFVILQVFLTTLLKVYVRGTLFEKSRSLLLKLESLGFAEDEVPIYDQKHFLWIFSHILLSVIDIWPFEILLYELEFPN